MALQTSGQISLKNIADEFGDTAPHSMSEFYGAASGVPTSGAISIGNFYGISSAYAFTKTLSSSVQNYNLRSDLLANGWDGVTPVNATITINPGVYVWTDSTSSAAFSTGSIVSDSIINIINQGYIMGKGGEGGGVKASVIFWPQAGGPAMDISYPITIDNTYSSAYIGGGGGGGGRYNGGSNVATNGGGGGAGGGKGGDVIYSDGGNSPGGSGGNIGQSGSNGVAGTAVATNSGGGGGRIFPGTGGAAVGSTAASKLMYAGLGGSAGGSGGFGKLSSSGAGYSGAGGSAGNVGGNATGLNGGGGGGGWGASGGNYGQAGGVGAAGGKAINTNGNAVTWVSGNTTRVYGAVA